MMHIAIMKPEWKLTPKILSGEKTIESRWYKSRHAPWNRIKKNDTVYFREGSFILARAGVADVLQFSDLTPGKVRKLLDKYAEKDGIKDEKEKFFRLFKNRKYCMLIFLKNPKKTKPFRISKKGFGVRASWICTSSLGKIRK